MSAPEWADEDTKQLAASCDGCGGTGTMIYTVGVDAMGCEIEELDGCAVCVGGNGFEGNKDIVRRAAAHIEAQATEIERLRAEVRKLRAQLTQARERAVNALRFAADAKEKMNGAAVWLGKLMESVDESTADAQASGEVENG